MKERRKWETTHGAWGPPGRSYAHQDYPIMLYRASRPSSGGGPLFEHVTADSPEREAYARTQGYIRGGPTAALAHLEAQEREMAELAAERAFHERRMSPAAQAEAAAVDASTLRHVPSVPETPRPPKKRTGWPKGKARKPNAEPIA